MMKLSHLFIAKHSLAANEFRLPRFPGYTVHYMIERGIWSTCVRYEIRHGKTVETTGIVHSSISDDDILLIGSCLPLVTPMKGKLHNESQCRILEVFGCPAEATRAAHTTWAKADARHFASVEKIKAFNIRQLRQAFGA